METEAVRDISIQGNDTWYFQHAWSPDDRFFVVVSNDGKRRYQLQTVSVLTGVARVLLKDSVLLISPHWDASSSSIVYLRGSENGAEVWRQQVSTSGVAIGGPRLVMPFLDASAFHLVENGRHLAFSRIESVANFLSAASATTRQAAV